MNLESYKDSNILNTIQKAFMLCWEAKDKGIVGNCETIYGSTFEDAIIESGYCKNDLMLMDYYVEI